MNNDPWEDEFYEDWDEVQEDDILEDFSHETEDDLNDEEDPEDTLEAYLYHYHTLD